MHYFHVVWSDWVDSSRLRSYESSEERNKTDFGNMIISEHFRDHLWQKNERFFAGFEYFVDRVENSERYGLVDDHRYQERWMTPNISEENSKIILYKNNCGFQSL